MNLPDGPEGYTVSADPSKLDLDLVYRFLSQESYWAADIPQPVFVKSVENAICFGVYKGQEQVGFARVITDKATFAYLADVFILPDERGKGLSKWLLSHVHAHPDLQGLRRWMLMTKDAHKLYAQFGWTSASTDTCNRMMQKHDPGIYRKS